MKRGLLVILLVCACSSVFALTTIDSCQTLNSADTYELNQSIEGTNDCMYIYSDDTTLDCKGYTMHFGDGGAGLYGVFTNSDNVTVRNCIINFNNSDTAPVGIYSTGNELQVINNTINISGTNFGTVRGVYLFPSNGSIVTNNTILLNRTAGAYCVEVRNSWNLEFSSNSCQSIGTGGGKYGFLDYPGQLAHNVTVSTNTIVLNSSSNGNGAVWQYGNNWTIRDNVVASNAATFDSGGFDIRGEGSEIINNSLHLTSTTGSSTAISMQSTSRQVSIINNSINMTGLVGSGIWVYPGPTNSIIQGNTMTVVGANSAGIAFFSGANTTTVESNNVTAPLGASCLQTLGNTNQTVSDLVCRGGGYLIRTGSGDTIQFENHEVSSSAGSISFNSINVSGTLTIGASGANISNGVAFVDSATYPVLNTSARITLSNTVFINPVPKVSSDGVTYTDCPPSQCTEVSYDGSTYVFDVSHFTFYTAGEGSAVPEFSTWVMLLMAAGIMGIAMFRRQ